MNKKERTEYMRKWRGEHNDIYKKYQREYKREYRKTKKYKKYQIEYMREYRKTHIKTELEKKTKRDYQQYKVNNDMQYKLATILRRRLYGVIKKNFKVGSAVKDLGCSLKELKNYLENNFKDEMSWDNYGKYGWHIDHMKPLSSFDLTNKIQFLEACNYTNLQPLWAFENLKKGNRE